MVNGIEKKLWESSNTKDFTFIVKYEQKIMAHKFVVRRYSTVLSEIFKSNVNHLKTDTFNFAAVHNVLELCYDLQPFYASLDNLLQSLHFANVYKMPVIKEQIERILNGYINTTNVVKLANKSLEYNAPILKGYCFTYISKCIEDGKQYDEASNLHQEIIDELYKSSVFRTVMS